MAYLNGFLTNATNPRQAVYDIAKTFLLANGFTMLEDFGALSGTGSPGAACVLRHTASGTVMVMAYNNNVLHWQPADDYDAGTNTLIGPAYNTGVMKTYDASGKYPNLVLNVSTPTALTNQLGSAITPSSNSLYQFVVFGDAYAVSIDSTTLVMDTFTPFHATANRPPNFGGYLLMNSGPTAVGSTVHGATVGAATPSGSLVSSSLYTAFGDPQVIEPYSGNRTILQVQKPPLVALNFASGVSLTTSQRPIGVFSTIRCTYFASTPTLGDTATDGTVTYLILPSDSGPSARAILRRE